MIKNNFLLQKVHATSGTLVMMSSIALLCVIPLLSARGQNPSSGTVGPAPGGPTATWQGTATAPGGGVNTESACVDGVNCEVYTLTVSGTPANWANQRVQVQLNWGSSLNEYDIYIHKGTLSGPLVTSAMAGPGLTNQTAFIVPATSGTGVFVVHVVYDTTPNVTDHYTGTASAVPLTPVPPPAAPQDTGPKIGYENFEAPGVLTPVVVTSSGGLTVEYMGRGAGEPSVGSDWNTGVANFQSDLETLFVTFDDSCSLTNPKASWVNRRAPTSVAIDSDPIGFTDRQTGRVFAGELTLLSPDTVKISHTDSDGIPTTTEPTGWTAAQSGGPASAVDHETIGGGRYHLVGGVTPPHGTYPNAVYYCSQDIATALCSRSDDGGTTYGGSVAIYNLTACGGLHGHVKVSPVDGTVYVPNRQCGNSQAVVVSQDNGLTWAVHPVQNGTTNAAPGTIGTGDDPAIGIDSNGRVYFAFSNSGTAASVATSDDFGVTWQNIYNVGATFGINNAAFPAAVGGDKDRAAVAYYGANSGIGDSNGNAFTGFWHLYVAHTFDGGAHWTTSDVTPTLPMQRSGILRGGGAEIDRNLLDFFDITIDRDGRVLVGYVNGCAGGNCALAAPTAHGNTYSATATIARQSSGRRMLAAKDPTANTSVPGMPSIEQFRVGSVVHLGWNEADTGNSPITGYQILRGTASGAETLLKTVPGTQKGGTFTDLSAINTSKTYYYKVLAVNGVGTSCGNNEIAAPFVGDTCSGLIIHQNDPSHPEATGGSAGNPPAPELLIDYIAVGEPAGANNDLMFKMKVGDLSTIPPNSRWRIAWDWFSSPNEMYYIGMKADQNGAITFEYGTLADAGVPAVLVLGETPIATCSAMSTSCTLPGASAACQFKTDGTITMFVPKSAVGTPKSGDMLGAIGGKTITGDTPSTNTFERSTTFVDHTFIKGQADNAFPPATYTLIGNPLSVTVSASPTQIHEGQSATYTISCSPAPTKPLAVHFKMSGTASQGSGADYTLSPGSSPITIPAGQTSISITLNAPADVNPGGGPKSESAIMTLQPGTGYCPGPAATVTIVQP